MHEARLLRREHAEPRLRVGLGADEYVDYTQQEVGEAVGGADLALDTVGGGRPLDTRAIRRMVKRRGLKAGINDLHPHICRHTCATVWVSRPELELHEVQLLLGHARLTTTQRYLHASIPTLVEKFRAFS